MISHAYFHESQDGGGYASSASSVGSTLLESEPQAPGLWWPQGQSKVDLCDAEGNAMAFICPQSTVDKLEKEKMPRKGGRWWFSWRRRDFPAEEVGGHGPRVG